MRKKRHGKYFAYTNVLNRPLRAVLAKVDPEGLIKMGAPRDEYDWEADTITSILIAHTPHDDDDVFHVIWPVFKNWIGYKESDIKAQKKYRQVAKEIWDALKTKIIVRAI